MCHATVELILSEEFAEGTHLHELLKKKFPDTAIDPAIGEFVKYLVLAAGMNSDSPLPVASIVDEIWHTCILQTKEYERICRKAGFHGILHHRSASSVHVIEPDEELGLSWLANYVGQIDEFTDETLGYWPAAMNLVRKMGWSVQQLNGFCQHIFRKAAHAR